jgi:hypothetical protein
VPAATAARSCEYTKNINEKKKGKVYTEYTETDPSQKKSAQKKKKELKPIIKLKPATRNQNKNEKIKTNSLQQR